MLSIASKVFFTHMYLVLHWMEEPKACAKRHQIVVKCCQNWYYVALLDKCLPNVIKMIQILFNLHSGSKKYCLQSSYMETSKMRPLLDDYWALNEIMKNSINVNIVYFSLYFSNASTSNKYNGSICSLEMSIWIAVKL